MVDGVEPFAHVPSLSKLRLDLLGAERFDKHAADDSIKASGIDPARSYSLSHQWSEISLLDIQRIGQSKEEAEAPGSLADLLSVIESVDNSLVLLPIVVIHSSLTYLLFIIKIKSTEAF